MPPPLGGAATAGGVKKKERKNMKLELEDAIEARMAAVDAAYAKYVDPTVIDMWKNTKKSE